MTVVTFESIKHLADELAPYEQARLIEHLSRRLVVAKYSQPHPVERSTAIDHAWSQFFAVCEDIRRTYPHVNLVKRLEEDRRARDAALWGAGTQGDREYVHP